MEQKYEICHWLQCSEEYLDASLILLQNSLEKKEFWRFRPAILLFGYFLENLLKATIIKKKDLAESEIKLHISFKLLIEAGYPQLLKVEEELIEFLYETVIWGKYPKKGKGDAGEKIKSEDATTINIYSNQTYVFTDPNHLLKLFIFSLKMIDYSKSIICPENTNYSDIDFLEILNRFIYKISSIVEILENRR